MYPIIIALITVVLLVLAILSGIHVAVALGILSFLGVWAIKGDIFIALNLLGTTAYHTPMEYVLSVVPMFIFLGLFGNMAGASEDIYDSANVLLARVRGGMGIATVGANAVFAAITGSSIASAAVFSKISYPQMMRLGYDKKLAMGTVIGSSVLGMLIPPSGLMVIYGYLTEQAIGKLFIAGVFPGLILAGIYAIGIYMMVTIKPHLGGRLPDVKAMSFGKYFKVIFRPWLFVLMIFFVLGGIYQGWFTPTEAGAVGAFVAFMLCLFKRKMTLKSLWQLLLEAGITFGSLFVLFIGAQLYSRMLALSTLPMKTTEVIGSLAMPAWMVIVMFIVIYLVLGALLDSVSILLITTPIMFPIISSLGFDPIWYAVVAVVAIEIGLLTPPFGICVFTMKAALGDQVTVEEGFRGSVPFMVMMLIALIIVCFIPSLSTWLPSHM
ncbi:MAG: TRAP transporter large permease [Pseudomonadota bacterium]